MKPTPHPNMRRLTTCLPDGFVLRSSFREDAILQTPPFQWGFYVGTDNRMVASLRWFNNELSGGRQALDLCYVADQAPLDPIVIKAIETQIKTILHDESIQVFTPRRPASSA